MRVLVVDDEAALRRSPKLALELERYTVTLARDASLIKRACSPPTMPIHMLETRRCGFDSRQLLSVR